MKHKIPESGIINFENVKIKSFNYHFPAGTSNFLYAELRFIATTFNLRKITKFLNIEFVTFKSGWCYMNHFYESVLTFWLLLMIIRFYLCRRVISYISKPCPLCGKIYWRTLTQSPCINRMKLNSEALLKMRVCKDHSHWNWNLFNCDFLSIACNLIQTAGIT